MREALLNNLKDLDTFQLKSVIEDGIASKEETILVGLGVLFEKYYNALDEEKKKQFISHLASLI